MINRTNGSKWGIKDTGVDFTPEIHGIIDNAQSFIVVCGYNFSPYNHRTSIIPRLISRKTNRVKVLVIAPPDMWAFGKKNHTTNIQYLVTNGIGVILNSKNHSKWILSDAGYYYGSLNFTAESMTKKVEVVSYCDTFQRVRGTIPQWMTETKEELLDFSIAELKKFNSSIHTVNLGSVNANILATLRRALTKILKYNPSLEKIETTLLNYEDVRLELSSIIDELFPIVTFKTLDKYWEQINITINILTELVCIGNDIWIYEQTDGAYDDTFKEYNLVYSNFVSAVSILIEISESNKSELFVQQKIKGLTQELEYGLIDYKKGEDES